MMKLNGTSLYPAAFFNALDQISGVTQSYITVTSEDRLSDNVCVTVAVRDASLTEEKISRRLQASLRVKPRVVIESEEAVTATIYTKASRKPVRFLDKRNGGPPQ
jgi:phenylacetate-CoA ligase